MSQELLTDVQVAKTLGIGRSSVWRHLANGKLPQPVRLFGGTTRWRLTDIKQFVEAASQAT